VNDTKDDSYNQDDKNRPLPPTGDILIQKRLPDLLERNDSTLLGKHNAELSGDLVMKAKP